MSRTKKNKKSVGKDFTSKRLNGYPSACKVSKDITIRKERILNKKIIKKEVEDINNGEQ